MLRGIKLMAEFENKTCESWL